MKKAILVRFVSDSCSCTFSSKEYAYYTDNDDIQVDDWCVVMVSDVVKSVKVTKVKGLSRSEVEKASKWIIAKVDLASFAEDMKRRDLIQELENTMDEIMAQEERYQVYERYAASNPRLAELLAEVRALEGSNVKSISQ